MAALYDSMGFTVSGNGSDGQTQTMEIAGIRSERSTDVRWVVIGGGPVSHHLRRRLANPRQRDDVPSDRSEAPMVLVLVADDGDFAAITGQRPEVRRAGIIRDVQDALAPGREGSGQGSVAQKPLRVVVISSAVVCGASLSRGVIEDSDPVVTGHEPGIAGDLALYEASVRESLDGWGDEAPPLTMVRCASLVGPEVDTMITRHFEAPRLLAVREADRPWQFLHVDDLVTAVRLVVDQDIDGAVTAGAVRSSPDGTVVPDVEPTETVARIASRRIIALRSSAAFSTAERLHRTGVLTAPASDLAYAVYPWTVGSATLAEHGWRSTVSSAECTRQIADQVRGQLGMGGRRWRSTGAAALGAAGAAVALVGTAALLRQSHGRR